MHAVSRFIYADADHRASGRTRAKRRDADLAFLALVIQLREQRNVQGLAKMLREHAQGPEWKLVALKRALKKAVMG